MKKSTRVTLTLVAACAAHAQQPANPCAPGSFDAKACKVAVKAHGYCDGGTWTSQDYQKYPYYYDLHSVYLSAGGVSSPPPSSTCRVTRSGFGTHGATALLSAAS